MKDRLQLATEAAKRFIAIAEGGEAGLASWHTALKSVAAQIQKAMDEMLFRTTFRCLFVSTAHLSPETCKLMDTWCSGIDLTRREYSNAPVQVAATDTGWFVNAAAEEQGSLPDDLWSCIGSAKNHGCDIIQFDADGDEIPGQPNRGGPGRPQPA